MISIEYVFACIGASMHHTYRGVCVCVCVAVFVCVLMFEYERGQGNILEFITEI